MDIAPVAYAAYELRSVLGYVAARPLRLRLDEFGKTFAQIILLAVVYATVDAMNQVRALDSDSLRLERSDAGFLLLTQHLGNLTAFRVCNLFPVPFFVHRKVLSA